MATSTLNVTAREKTGKGISRELRRQWLIPAVVYGPDMEPCPITVDPKELKEAINTESGINTLITLKGDGPFDGKVVILKDLEVSAIKQEPLHADFHAFNMTKKVHVMVPLIPVGTSIGEKEGGNLEIIRHELEVVCLPTDIPSSIEVDISALEIGDSVHVEEVPLPDGVEIPEDVNFTVITCTMHRVEEEPSEEEELAEGLEGVEVAAAGEEAEGAEEAAGEE